MKLNGNSFSFANLSGGSGNIQNGHASNASTIAVGSDNSSTAYSGTLTNGSTAALGLTKTGSGLLALSSSNSYSGGTTVSGGTLQLGNNSSLGTGGLTANAGTVELLGGVSPVVTSLSGAAGRIVGSSSTLTVNQSTTTTFAGSLADEFASLSLSKTGAGTLVLAGSNSYSGATTLNAGVLKVGAVNALSANSDFTVNGGTLDARGYAQTVNSLTVGSLGSLNLSVGNLLTSTNAASFDGTLNIFNFTSGSAELMAYGSSSGTFAAFTGIPGGYHLAYNPTELDIALNTTSTTYNLAAAVSAGLLHSGGTATVSATITNTGTGINDSLNYTGLNVTAPGGSLSGGSLPMSGGPLAQSASDSGSSTYTASVAGTYSVTPTVTTATNATIGGNATLGTTGITSISVFSGSGAWSSSSGSLYGDATNWTDSASANVHAAPGTFAGFANTDVAAFSGTGSVTTVSLSGASPSLAA